MLAPQKIGPNFTDPKSRQFYPSNPRLFLRDHVAGDFTLQIFHFAKNWDKHFSIIHAIFVEELESKLKRSLALSVT